MAAQDGTFACSLCWRQGCSWQPLASRQSGLPQHSTTLSCPDASAVAVLKTKKELSVYQHNTHRVCMQEESGRVHRMQRRRSSD